MKTGGCESEDARVRSTDSEKSVHNDCVLCKDLSEGRETLYESRKSSPISRA